MQSRAKINLCVCPFAPRCVRCDCSDPVHTADVPNARRKSTAHRSVAQRTRRATKVLLALPLLAAIFLWSADASCSRRNEEISASMTGTAPPPPPVSSTSTVDMAVASASTVPSSDVNSPPNTRFGSATRDPSGNLPSAQPVPIASSSSGSQPRSTGGQSTSIPRSVVAGTGPPRRTRAQVHAAYAANNTHESHQGSGGSEAFREKHDSVPLIQGDAANGDASNGGRVKADTDMPDGMH